jgi:hypothetical protein
MRSSLSQVLRLLRILAPAASLFEAATGTAERIVLCTNGEEK